MKYAYLKILLLLSNFFKCYTVTYPYIYTSSDVSFIIYKIFLLFLDKNCVEDADKQAMLHTMKEIETYIQKLFPSKYVFSFVSC